MLFVTFSPWGFGFSYHVRHKSRGRWNFHDINFQSTTVDLISNYFLPHLRVNYKKCWSIIYKLTSLLNENKYNKKSITEDKYKVSKDFIQRKREEIRALHERYITMTPEERHEFNMEFEQVKKDIQQNANSEDFVVDAEVADAVENPQSAEPEKVHGEVVEKAPFEE